MVQLLSFEKTNGSWKVDEDLTKILGTKLKDIKAANPVKVRYKEKQREECMLQEVTNRMIIEVNQGLGEKKEHK